MSVPPSGAYPAAPSSPPARLIGPGVWLLPLAAVVAVIGAILPWFDPSGSKDGQKVLQAESKLYSWQDGRIGLLAPILLVIIAIQVIAHLYGKQVGRFAASRPPQTAAAYSALGVGAVSAILLVVAWFFVPSQFNNVPADAGGSWNGAKDLGIDMTRGPQLGFWLTAVAAAIALVAGVVLLVTRRPTPAAPAAFTPPASGHQGWGPPQPGSWPPAGQSQPQHQQPQPQPQPQPQQWQPQQPYQTQPPSGPRHQQH